ncbi:MAG: DUF805 domain-containing protein [Marivita sp.]|mgnify:CR=1 FL=1|uniref:DUF805 domain-containing protein n=1 Tax=Marivita sp. TaxID=2003365 RepID=UPI0025C279BE|nr:DUF805 domain-containing protein [Marivita sp.]MCI5112501.1 DUF805 domain-containing protein [Marivita sp.]
MENIKTAVNTVLSKYATFTGRASRSEFWWWILAVFLTLIVVGIVDAILFGTGPEAGQPISALVSLGLLLPNIAVGARRMHDIGKSGWWLLIGLIPVIGFFVLLYFYVQPSEPETNQYGAPEPFRAG